MSTETAKIIDFPSTRVSDNSPEGGAEPCHSSSHERLLSADYSLPERLLRKDHYTPGENALYIEWAKTLRPMKLRRIFDLEANSDKNMRRREKSGTRIIHSDFKDWRSFLISRLIEEGPCPKGHTLDRINNDDLEYAPGKVRWADATKQNNNRSNTIYLQPEGHPRRPLTDYARQTGQNPETIRSRLRNDWTHTEAVFPETRKNSNAANLRRNNSSPLHRHPWPDLFPNNPAMAERWEKAYRNHASKGEYRIAFFIRLKQKAAGDLSDKTSQIVDTHGEPIYHEDENGQPSGMSFDLPPEWNKPTQDIDERYQKLQRGILSAMAWREQWLQDCAIANGKKR